MRTAGSEASEDSEHIHGARKGERMLPVPTCYLLLVCAASLVFCCVFLCAPRSCLGLYWFLFTMFSLVLVSAWWTGCFVVNTADRIMGLGTYSTVVAHRNGDSSDTISNEGDDDDWSILHHVHNGIDHSSYDEQYGGGENGGGGEGRYSRANEEVGRFFQGVCRHGAAVFAQGERAERQHAAENLRNMGSTNNTRKILKMEEQRENSSRDERAAVDDDVALGACASSRVF